MKTYMIPFAYEKYGRMCVEADNPIDAIRKAEDILTEMSVSEMESLSDYLEDSEAIDYDGIILDEDGNIIE